MWPARVVYAPFLNCSYDDSMPTQFVIDYHSGLPGNKPVHRYVVTVVPERFNVVLAMIMPRPGHRPNQDGLTGAKVRRVYGTAFDAWTSAEQFLDGLHAGLHRELIQPTN